MFTGWIRNDEEVDRIAGTFPNPIFQTPAPSQENVFNHTIFKAQTGRWAHRGWQLIGDCVSWGHSRACNYDQVLASVYEPKRLLDFQETCTEWVYGGSRVEIGQRRLGRGDGSVGAWAARWGCNGGFLSRLNLATLGQPAEYDPDRARQWGYDGVPNDLEPAGLGHKFLEATLVKYVSSAISHIQNGRVVPVCSNIGFQNDRGGTRRDEDGNVRPEGEWGHCMTFTSVRFGRRPSLLLENQWQPELTFGPMGEIEIPPSSWWVDMEVADEMLQQGDSWAYSTYAGYPSRKLSWRF